MTAKPRIVVVGAGPAGLMAAGRAAEVARGRAEVLLLEKMARPGNKLRLTGNGRCNLANDCDRQQFLAHVEPAGDFLRNSLARFYVRELRDFLASRGVPTRREPDGRIYPTSDSAADVLTALQRYGAGGGVVLRTGSPVAEIVASEREPEADVKGGAGGSRQAANHLPTRIRSLRLADGTLVEASQVILATGGQSYPATGSTGDGYRLATRLGHTVTPLRPGLVPLVSEEEFVPVLQGISLRDVCATLWRGECSLAGARGDLLFTHYGLSGPAILSLSLRAAFDEGPARLRLDLLPELGEAELDQRLRHDMARAGSASHELLLRGYVPRTLAEVLATASGIPRDRPLSQLTAEQRRCAGRMLKAWEIPVLGTRPMREAMVTVGGVATREVEPRTMASRLVHGLYLAGEVLDVAGDTGGYNLQIAFTTGYVAGESAAVAATARGA